MKPLNATTALWNPHRSKVPSTLRSVPDRTALLSNFEDNPDTPICCWNLCSSYSGVKRPRPVPSVASSTTTNISPVTVPTSASLWKPTSPLGDAPSMPTVAKRLLVERVSDDCSLVFNALSGAVDVFTNADLAELELLRRNKESPVSPDRRRFLRERGYLWDDGAEEDKYLQQSVMDAWQRMKARQPEMYTVCPTLACNLACAYCFEGDSLTDKPQGVMTDLQVEHLFAAITRLRAAQAADGTSRDGTVRDGTSSTSFPSASAPWIALFGGEPFLPSTRSCISAILRSAAKAGFLVGATTNGVNLTRFEAILTEYADILTTFQISLDGPKAVHDSRRHRLGGQGTFDEIVRGIDLLLFLGVGVDLRVNLDQTNLAALPELANFIFQKGWNQHPGFALVPAGVTAHGTCSSEAHAEGADGPLSSVLSEAELTQGVLALLEISPNLAEICNLGFLRHLDHLVSVLEPHKRRDGRKGSSPRYWYCEASTDKQFVFTPEGLIYSCTEAVGKPRHAIGRFDPALELWQEQAQQWIGRTILSHPQCHACSLSTLCGGGCHFAACEQTRSGTQENKEEPLLQITVRTKAAPAPLPVQPIQPAGSGSQSTSGSHNYSQSDHPYCNDAERTIRTYLSYIGRFLFHSASDR